MMFKNSLKLVTANFYNFWKILLYKVVVYSVSALLLCVFFNTIQTAVIESGLPAYLSTILNPFIFLSDITLLMQNLFFLLKSFMDFFVILFSLNAFAGIYVVLIVFVVFPFLSNLAVIPMGENNYGYMSSLSKTGFMQKYITKIGSSSIYSIYKTLINIIVVALMVLGNYGILYLSNLDSFIIYLVPIFFFAFNIGFLSLYQTFMSGFMPAVVVYSDGVHKGFRIGIKAVFRRFFRVLSSLVAINILSFALYYLFGAYSLILLIPLYTDLMITFQMVMFFGSNGMSYYVDLDTILRPKKLETYDKYKKVKDLI